MLGRYLLLVFWRLKGLEEESNLVQQVLNIIVNQEVQRYQLVEAVRKQDANPIQPVPPQLGANDHKSSEGPVQHSSTRLSGEP